MGAFNIKNVPCWKKFERHVSANLELPVSSSCEQPNQKGWMDGVCPATTHRHCSLHLVLREHNSMKNTRVEPFIPYAYPHVHTRLRVNVNVYRLCLQHLHTLVHIISKDRVHIYTRVERVRTCMRTERT